MSHLARFIFITTFPLIWQFEAVGQTPQDVAKQTLPSIVVLVSETGNGKPVALGSGFFVRKDVIATNFHVIKGASQIRARVVGQSRSHPIKRILAFDGRKDLALLLVSGLEGTPLWIGNSCGIEVGDTVFAVGNPKGLEGTFSQGTVSAIRKLKGNRYIQITAPVSEGSSGGPVLNESGEVIGIAVASVRQGQNLNFAVSGLDLEVIILKTVGAGFGVSDIADLVDCINL